MILGIGATKLAQNEVNVRQIMKYGVLGPLGTYIARREKWFVKGRARAASQAALKTLVDARKTTFSLTDYDRDVIFYFNDGTTSTGDSLLSSGSANGVVMSPVVWGDGGVSPGPQWVHWRDYSFTVEAEYPPADDMIISYFEEVELIGDGSPDYEIFEYLVEVPDSQTTKAYTKSAFRQWGRAVGLLSTPTPPAPIATPKPFTGIRITPGYPMQKGRKIDRGWPIRWAYYGEGPLAFSPPVWT